MSLHASSIQNPHRGYAVVDTETTGLYNSDRIVEIAVVHVDPNGCVTGEWHTLLNPSRDLGPTSLHGIFGADVWHAPSFGQAAAWLADLLRGRVIVAHNLPFDARMLHREYEHLGVAMPIVDSAGLCTMRLSNQFLSADSRRLTACCAAAGIPTPAAHTALGDARATTALLAHYLEQVGTPAPWQALFDRAAHLPWPSLSTATPFTPYPRRAGTDVHPHFLARIVERLPSAQNPDADAYLAFLDQALLDRVLSVAEQDTLVQIANDLGLCRTDLDQLHRDYLVALARAAWEDHIVTPAEHGDLDLVARLLDLTPGDVNDALSVTRPAADHSSGYNRVPLRTLTGFRLLPGDLVVFTGEDDEPRSVWQARAQAFGVIPYSAVTKRVRLLVAADPDSLSGKAKKARQYGLPVITYQAFAALVGQLAEGMPAARVSSQPVQAV